jgi:hypothetical protein
MASAEFDLFASSVFMLDEPLTPELLEVLRLISVVFGAGWSPHISPKRALRQALESELARQEVFT